MRDTSAALPPVAVTGLTVMGIPLQEWVFILTIVWVVLQILFILYDRIKGKNK